MRIHREGLAIVLSVMIFFMVLYVLVAHFASCNTLLCYSTGIAGILLVTFTLFFFRNPVRKVSSDQSIVYAPADGKIIAIEA